MGSRLELILSVILVLVIAIALHSNNRANKNKSSSKGNDIEIVDAQLIEANATDRLDDMIASLAYQNSGVWYFKNINLSATDIKELRADSAVRAKDYLELVGDVVMLSNDGSRYMANRAVYLTDKKIFYTMGRFRAERNGTLAIGKNFYHDKLKGYSRAQKVYGVYQMSKKSQ